MVGNALVSANANKRIKHTSGHHKRKAAADRDRPGAQQDDDDACWMISCNLTTIPIVFAINLLQEIAFAGGGRCNSTHPIIGQQASSRPPRRASFLPSHPPSLTHTTTIPAGGLDTQVA